MTHFIGEVVRWNPGDHHALVRASHVFSKTGMDSLSLFKAEQEFPPKGTAMWVQPEKAMLNRFVLFQKQPANQFGDATKTPKFRSEVKDLQVVVPNPWPKTRKASPDELLPHVAEILSSSDLHLFCQGFRVFIKDEEQQLDYYGPFEMNGGRVAPPKSLTKIKRYRSMNPELPLIRMGEWDFTLIHPDAELEKVDEIRIHVPTVAGALEKLGRLYPQLALEPHLVRIRELLTTAEGLEADEVALLSEQLASTDGVHEQLSKLLPILAEHASVSGYFDSELRKHKKAIEEVAHGEALKQLSALKQEAMDLHKKAHAERDELSIQRTTLGKEHEAIRAKEEALAARELAIESLGTRLKGQGKEFADEVAFGLRTGFLLTPNGVSPIPLNSEAPWSTPEDFLAVVRQHPPLARVFAALKAQRVPLVCGPRSLKLLQTFARIACGGVARTIPIDPLTVRIRDLIGTFVNGRFQAHSSGLAHLLMHSAVSDHPSLVIFEGVNRAAVELVLDPILQTKGAGIPLFPEESFQPDDPWSPLGGQVWPSQLLVAATLSAGVSTQRIAPPTFGEVMLVDEDGWPRTEPDTNAARLRNGLWDEFIIPKPSGSMQEACEDFIEVVPNASWAGRGVPACIAHLEELVGEEKAMRDAMSLIWGPAALSTDVAIETFEDHLEGNSKARLRNLSPYLL